MTDVSVRASLEGFDRVDAALKNTAQAVDRVTDAQTASVQASLKYAEAWTKQHQPIEAASEDVQKILNRYDPLGAKLRQLQSDFVNLDKAITEGKTGGTSDIVLDKTMLTLKNSISETSREMNNGIKSVDDYGASIAGLALRYVAPIAVLHQFISMSREAVAVGREAELQNIRLNTVLQSTGMVAGFTGTQLHNMANAMQESLAIDSEQVKRAMTVLLTFTNIQGDMFTKTLKLGADFARLYGGDMASAVRMFGRAFEDPERGVTMLRRANIILSEEQIKLVKDLANTGDQLGAMATLLDIVQGKMNNVAEAIGQSGVSAIDRFKNAWSDMMKEIAKTPRDPEGAGGEWFGFGADAMKFATEQMAKFREMQTNLWLIYYGVVANSSFVSEEMKLDAAKKFDALRKATGIKTAEELAAEQLVIEESKNKKFDEDMKKYWKDWADLQVKQINDRKALGMASAEDEARLMQFAAEQESRTETERLSFLAKSLQAKKEGQKFSLAEVDATQQMNDLASKGNQARLSTELTLGTLGKERYEALKTAEELRKNDIDQGLVEQRLALSEELGVKSQTQIAEHNSLLIARERLQLEREQIRLRGDTAAETARRAVVAAELKDLGTVSDLRTKSIEQGDAAAVNFRSAQKEKLDGLERELSLVGKTKTEKEITVALHKLEVDYTKALGGLVFVNVEQYQRQFDLITTTYEKTKSELPRLIKANQDAANEVTEFWKQAARNMQDAMSNLFFDIMQGKLSDLAGSFKQSIDRMGANVLAAKAAVALFGKDFVREPGASPIGGLVGQGLGWLGGLFGGGNELVAPSLPGMSSALTTTLGFQGYATGGSFTVGGSGGTDSQSVGFRATPGEKVTVETPEQQRKGGRAAINFNGPLIAVYANDAQSFNRSKGQIGAEMFTLASNFARRFS